jgi:Carboxypeptidase regulatory-like domain/Domain of unknown function (DUF4214)
MCILTDSNSRRAFSMFAAVTLIVAGCVPVSAQSGGSFQITNSVVAAGGGESKDVVNNRFSHESTVGEHATGTLLQSPPYSLTAGFRASQIDLTPTSSSASILGRIQTSAGAPLAGATINLAGTRAAQTITDANGFYSFASLEIGGLYTITPARVNYSFNPSSRSLSLLANGTEAVFTAIASGGTANPLDTTEFFVRQHYLDFLGREPDPAGLAFWTNEINSCGTNQVCIEVKRLNVSAAFFLSIEFQQTGYLVERFYKTAYGNANGSSTFGGTHQLAVPTVRFTEFLSDTQQIGLGVVVGQNGWEQLLENNKQAFAAGFVQRSRFITALPLSLTAAQFVDTLNANAGNPLSAAERNQLVTDLSTNAKSRAQVLRAIAEDQDLSAAESNRGFVLMQFFGYLRRNPSDPQDSDHTGFDFWLTKLNQFNGDYINAEMVRAFITSIEYRQRFGP